MNIHLPAILMFTRYQGFDPSPCGKGSYGYAFLWVSRRFRRFRRSKKISDCRGRIQQTGLPFKTAIWQTLMCPNDHTINPILEQSRPSPAVRSIRSQDIEEYIWHLYRNAGCRSVCFVYAFVYICRMSELNAGKAPVIITSSLTLWNVSFVRKNKDFVISFGQYWPFWEDIGS